MPVSKATKLARIAAHQCCLCAGPAALKRDGTHSHYCERHLSYFQTLRRAYANENGEGRTNRCSVCRKVGHLAPKCPDRIPTTN